MPLYYKTVSLYRHIVEPVFVYVAIFLIIASYLFIFFTLERNETVVRHHRFTGHPVATIERTAGRMGTLSQQNSTWSIRSIGSTRSNNQSPVFAMYKRFASFHSISLVVCTFPSATFRFVLFAMGWDEETSSELMMTYMHLYGLSKCNSVVNPLMFFLVVYQRWRQQNNAIPLTDING